MATSRARLTDDEFYAALGLSSISKDAAISVRAMISDAVRIPEELIVPNDNVRELETIGDPLHESTLDFFEDMWSVRKSGNEVTLVTVRDFVNEFGARGNKS